MCFLMNNKNDKVQIATKDIVVYKTFSSGKSEKTNKKIYISPYQDFKYEPGECYYESRPFIGKRKHREIRTGIHSYCNIITAQDKADYIKSRKVVKYIIPEGAKFYKNNREYVSNYLIIGKQHEK